MGPEGQNGFPQAMRGEYRQLDETSEVQS
jgi:hypothetical protein